MSPRPLPRALYSTQCRRVPARPPRHGARCLPQDPGDTMNLQAAEMSTTHRGPAVCVEGVFAEHGPRVYSVARRMLGNDADAEDVTQEVLLQVIRKADGFRGESLLS